MVRLYLSLAIAHHYYEMRPSEFPRREHA
jgi:hypothetical protein